MIGYRGRYRYHPHLDLENFFKESALQAYLKPGQKMPNVGTRAYARLGAKHARTFAKANEEYLRSVPITVEK